MAGKIKIRPWMMWLLAAAVIYLPGLVQMQELRSRRNELQSEVERLRKENAALEREKQLLTRDTDYVERVARKQMGVVRKGEIPYRIIVEEVPAE